MRDKAVIICNPDKKTSIVNDSILNAFEYYIAIKKYINPDIKLYLFDFSQSQAGFLIGFFESRYINLPKKWKENLVILDGYYPDDLNLLIRKGLILDLYTYSVISSWVEDIELTVISENLDRCKGSISRKNVEYFAEMSTDFGRTYSMKMLLDHIKPPEKAAPNILIASSKYSQDRKTNFIKELSLPSKPIIFKSNKGIPDLFEKYNELVYHKSPDIWDSYPRIMHESAYFNKKITYMNNTSIQDGSHYRYEDLISNGTHARLFSENDPVLQRFC